MQICWPFGRKLCRHLIRRRHGIIKMKSIAQSIKSTVLFAVTLGTTISFVLLRHMDLYSNRPDPMSRSFVLWLHGLGDSAPTNEPIKTFFTSPVFRNNNRWCCDAFMV